MCRSVSIVICEVQACVSEFVSFITAEAGDHSAEGSRRSIDADDILWALTALGFEHYIDPLQVAEHWIEQIFYTRFDQILKQAYLRIWRRDRGIATAK